MQGFKTQRGAIIVEQTETTRPEPQRGAIIIEQNLNRAKQAPAGWYIKIDCDICKPLSQIGLIYSYSDARLFIDKVQQPSRTNKQKLKVFKKARFFTFYFMSVKLPNPGGNKND